LNESSFRVFCDCKAGTFQQLCKHKTAFLDNDRKMLHDPAQQKELDNVHEWLKQTSWSGKYTRITKEIAGIEKDVAQLQTRRKELRKDFSVMLSKGVNVEHLS